MKEEIKEIIPILNRVQLIANPRHSNQLANNSKEQVQLLMFATKDMFITKNKMIA